MGMEHIVAWTQWPDLTLSVEAADRVELLSDPDGVPAAADLARITCYVPPYMSGAAGMAPVADMPALRLLQVPNAGFDDAIAFLRPGMTLCNARGVHDEATAELAVGLAIAGRRGFAAFGASQRAGRWRRDFYRGLTDAKIAVVGHGSIGRTIVRMLGGFTVAVTSFSRRGTDGARPVAELAEVIGGFDVVLLILPLTAESSRLFDASMLARMKDGALLVNVSRGPVVDTDALLAELESGRLHAAVDVTDPEPLPDGHPLFSAPNCLVTPHVGGFTASFEPRMRALVSDQLARLASGRELRNVVAVG